MTVTVIDFRYHLVSLVSVFLALAVGIVLGAGPLKESIGDTLTGQVEQLRGEKDALRASSTPRPAPCRTPRRTSTLPGRSCSTAPWPTAAWPSSRSARSTSRSGPRSTSGSRSPARASPRTCTLSRDLGRPGRTDVPPGPGRPAARVPRPGAGRRRRRGGRARSALVQALVTSDPERPGRALRRRLRAAGAPVVERERQPAGDGRGPGHRAGRRDRRPRRAVREAGRGRERTAVPEAVAAQLAVLSAAQGVGRVRWLGDRPRGEGSLTDAVLADAGPGRGPTTVSGPSASPARSTCRSLSPAGSRDQPALRLRRRREPRRRPSELRRGRPHASGCPRTRARPPGPRDDGPLPRRILTGVSRARSPRWYAARSTARAGEARRWTAHEPPRRADQPARGTVGRRGPARGRPVGPPSTRGAVALTVGRPRRARRSVGGRPRRGHHRAAQGAAGAPRCTSRGELTTGGLKVARRGPGALVAAAVATPLQRPDGTLGRRSAGWPTSCSPREPSSRRAPTW